MKFRVKRADRAAENSLQVGDVVYPLRRYDYDLAHDDTRVTGIQHVSMTKDPDGNYPFFTIPWEDLESLE